jgi:hypothetical protein
MEEHHREETIIIYTDGAYMYICMWSIRCLSYKPQRKEGVETF